MTTAEVLSELGRSGVRVWAEDGRLRYQAPRTQLTPEVIALLQQYKTDLLDLLQTVDVNPAPVVRPRDVQQAQSLPLSFGQDRLWFLDELTRNSAVYSVPFTLRLRGRLNLQALRASFDAIVARHEVLRTRFVLVEGRPTQRISPPTPLDLPVVDLHGVPQAQAEADRLIRQDIDRPFDLSSGRLLRLKLIRLADDDHLLLVNAHHIVFDGWSLEVLARELCVLYATFVRSETSALPDLTVQYADYALWQRSWLQGEVLEAQLDYWREAMRGAPALLELPTDRPRPSLPSHSGANVEFHLSQTLRAALEDLSRREGVTPFMALLAAFQVLLHRYSGADDIVIGTPSANRSRPELEGLIGFFVNTLAIRVGLSGALSFRDLLARVRETCLGAYAHQELPFEKLVEALQPSRSPGYSPVFQVMFSLNAPPPPIHLPDLIVDLTVARSAGSKFDLSLSLDEVSDGFAGALEYSADLFDESTIVRMAEHFRTLLEAIVANPSCRLADLSMLPDSERQQILSWNLHNQVEFQRGTTIHRLFESQARRTPEAIAVVSGERSLTYRGLDERANQLAHHLRALGVAPEARVGLCLERSLDLAIALLGILKAGGAYVPLDPAYPPERLAYMLQDAGVGVVVTDRRVGDRLPAHSARVVAMDAAAEVLAREPSSSPDVSTTDGNAAYVIYTSGSTGQPKGVVVPHSGLVNHAQIIARHFGLTPDDRMLQFASISFDTAAEELYPTWISGAALVLRPDWILGSFADFTRLVEQQRITILNLPTAYWHEWVHELSVARAPLPPRLRWVMVGGEKAAVDRVATWREIIGDRVRWTDSYGPTETTITATIYDLPTQPEVPCIGKPIANLQTYVLDEAMRLAPIGVPGELFIGGAGVARGYLGQPALTAERFVPDPFGSAHGGRLYRTGDLARSRPNGDLEFLGRRDHQVKIRGFRIELGEVESILGAHPAVREAAAIVREDRPNDKRLVAYVVVPSALPMAELRQFLQQRLPTYMVPSDIVRLDALPLTPNGKVDRRALPAPAERAPERDERYVAPRDDVQEIIAGVWQDVLGVERVGADDNFFELGGHSLLLTQALVRLRQAFRMDIDLQTVFRGPTVAALADLLRASEPRAGYLDKVAALRKQVGGMSAESIRSRLRPRTESLSN